MEWIPLKDKKPFAGQFCIVLGLIRDINGISVAEGFNYAWYTGNNYFTMGCSVGQLFEVDFWMPINNFPDLNWSTVKDK